jgi:hypothetical protein
MTRMLRRAGAAAIACLLAAAPGAVADNITPDDQITQGSTCTGFDCINNESFGFDTLKLKENNTRLKFEDTSTSAGLPTMDWELQTNGQNSGDPNFFALNDLDDSRTPFKVMGGAPTNSLFLQNNGNVGIGTGNPQLMLQLTKSDTPALRLEQTNGGGFNAQTWDVGGNEASFFVRDQTGGSRLPFRIRPGAPTNSVDILANGDVSTGGTFEQPANTASNPASPDGPDTLTKLAALPLTTYDLAGARHLGPSGADFRAAFGLGQSDNQIAPSDMAGVSLVAIKALNQRIDNLQLAKGAQGDRGDTGPQGPTGERGPAGAAGPAGGLDPAAAKQIKALQTANKKQDKKLKALERKLKALARARR